MTENPPVKSQSEPGNSTRPPRSLATWLWNPFQLVAGGPALFSGIGVLLFTGLLAAPTHTHFDGVLDTHVGFPAPLFVFLTEGIINWLCLAAVLWVGGVCLKGWKSFRALDLFGTQALARWPFLLTAVVCFLPPFRGMTEKLHQAAVTGSLTIPQASSAEWIGFTFVTLIMIAVTVWFVALAWKSFRISCDLRGGKAVATFIVGIIVAEALSKFAIMKGLASLIPGS